MVDALVGIIKSDRDDLLVGSPLAGAPQQIIQRHDLESLLDEDIQVPLELRRCNACHRRSRRVDMVVKQHNTGVCRPAWRKGKASV